MKKLIIIAMTIICITLTSCGNGYQEQEEEILSEDFGGGYFTLINKWSGSDYYCRIVYANDTKVKYLIMSAGNKFGITPLYNADGSLQVYEGK